MTYFDVVCERKYILKLYQASNIETIWEPLSVWIYDFRELKIGITLF